MTDWNDEDDDQEWTDRDQDCLDRLRAEILRQHQQLRELRVTSIKIPIKTRKRSNGKGFGRLP